MKKQKLAVWLVFAATQACTTAWAQAPSTSAPDRAVVEQKRTLVERLLSESKIADGEVRGRSAEAREKLSSAMQLVTRAQAHLDKGEIAAADRLLNDAMRHISVARTLAIKPGARTGEEETRFGEIIQSIEVLEASYLRNVERRSAWLAEVGDEDLKRVKILVDRAKTMASSGRLREANAVLVKAQRDMISSYNGLLGTAPMVIVYDLRFNTLEEEYQYESERGRDYGGLVPVAIHEYNPPSEALATINWLVDESRALAAEAKLDAQGKQFQRAILTQRQAITKLQRALELAGIVVPQVIPN